MVRKGAAWLSNIFIKRGWIDRDKLDWCIYALEKRFGLLMYVVTAALWIGFSGLLAETLSFIFPLYFLRRRMGGVHAKSNLSCYFVSICLLLFSTAFGGKWLLHLPSPVLLLLNLICITLAMLLPPVYPPQVHFSLKEIEANSRRKNLLLFLVLLIQCFSFVFHDSRILVHSFCAVVLSVVSVLIQKQKGRIKNEKA